MEKKKKLIIIILAIILFLAILFSVLFIIIGNKKTVTISYKSSDASMGLVSKETETVKVKGDLEGSTATANAGYSFVNWTLDGTVVSEEATFVPSKTNKKNVEATYIANFTANKYNVTFVGNYAESTYNVELQQSYNSLYVLPEANPEKVGYTFVGWFTATEGGEQVKADTVFSITSEQTLYAQYQANTYTVTFDGNESNEAYSESISQTYDSLYILPEVLPERLGYDFVGWFTDIEEGEEVTEETIVLITVDQTLYAHWTEACIAEGTLVTMKDGSTKAVENISLGDEVRTFDHETGKISYSTVCFVWKSELVGNIFTLHFTNDIDVTVIDKHGFYDADLNKYVFITLKNINDFIGHRFYNGDLEDFVVLEGYEKVEEKVNAYAIVTSHHLNHLANGMLSMCDGTVEYICNIFEYNDDMTFNKEDIDYSISLYGLTSQEEFSKYKGWTSQEYDDYNFKYLAIMVGKGIISYEGMQAYSDLYENNGI